MLFEVDRPGTVGPQVSGNAFEDSPAVNEGGFDVQGDARSMRSVPRSIDHGHSIWNGCFNQPVFLNAE
jgi:hypothetical protein